MEQRRGQLKRKRRARYVYLGQGRCSYLFQVVIVLWAFFAYNTGRNIALIVIRVNIKIATKKLSGVYA